MALIIFKDGTRKFLPADKAEAIWRVIHQEAVPTAEQARFCSRIQSVHLNKYGLGTPPSYHKYVQTQLGLEGLFPTKRSAYSL